MATNYTPGPWELDEADAPFIVNGPEDGEANVVCTVDIPNQHGQINAYAYDANTAKANARLIAAAPDLAAALAWALRFANTASMHDPEWTDADVDSYYAARSALEKAGVLE